MYHCNFRPWAVAQRCTTAGLASSSIFKITLVLRALERPRSLQDFRNCCQNTVELEPFSCCPVVGLAELVGLLVRGEAVPVPQDATSATVQNAADVALGRFDRPAPR
jgi:hypothetical protein